MVHTHEYTHTAEKQLRMQLRDGSSRRKSNMAETTALASCEYRVCK